ncbi:MAG: putative pectate lyase protein [Rariglobus sp.]|jgi:hypothetical protein|nr:putative pectate lyase protein [Rariglobus sp.]
MKIRSPLSLCTLAALFLATPFLRADATNTANAPAAPSWPTRGGEGGRIITVTSLDETGPGTLRAALDVNEPRIIRFAVAGEIWLSKACLIRHPFVTIDGASAPSPGITLIGDTVRIRSHDVIVRHIRIRAGARTTGSDPTNRDCLQIDGSSDGKDPGYNVLIENCSFAWSIDENVQMWGRGNHDIAVRRCIMAEALNKSLHAKGVHSAGMIVGPGIQRVVVEQNLFAHNQFRNPVVAAGAAALVVNNLVYNPGFGGMQMYGYDLNKTPGTAFTQVDLVGNVIIAGGDTRPRLGLFHNKTGIPLQSQVYLEDNLAIGTTTFDSSKHPITWPADGPMPFVQTPAVKLPVDASGLLPRVPAAQVEATVLASVGARPDDRDAVDTRIINEVKTRTGKIRDLPEDPRLHPKGEPQWEKTANEVLRY